MNRKAKVLGIASAALTMMISAAPISAANGDSGSTTITVAIGNEYTMTVPKSVNIIEGAVETNIGELYVEGAIQAGKKVEVGISKAKLMNGASELVYTLHDGVPGLAAADVNKIDFQKEDIVPGNLKKHDMYVKIASSEWAAAQAGRYSAIITFVAATV